MTGELIRFERRRGARSDLRAPPPATRESDARGSGIVELRVARITRLLSELEELTRRPRGIPLTTLDRAHAGIRRARRTIAGDLEGAPQPVLDDERIERMYRELNRDA